MKHFLYRALSLALIFTILTGLIGAAAAEPEYGDIAGHWAEITMKQAARDALIVASGNRLNPDGPITKAEAATILCRAFSAASAADLSGVSDVKQGDWFYASAAKGVSMGFLSPEQGRLNMRDRLTRARAFALLADAFQLIPAEPVVSVLSAYSDGDHLFGKERRAFASLVSEGVVKGYGGSLHLYDSVSRAEFLTVLYRIAGGFMDAAGMADPAAGSAVLKSGGAVDGLHVSGTVYFDGASSEIRLQTVSAGAVVLRSDTLASFSAESGRVGRLVLAARAGDVTIAPQGDAEIGTAVVGTGGGAVTLGGNLSGVEVTGDGRTVVLQTAVDRLLISGSNNTVTIAEGASAATVRLLASGSGNRLTIDGAVGELEVAGEGAVVDGAGSANLVNQNTPDSKISVPAGAVTVNDAYGLYGVTLELRAPDTLPAGQTLTAAARITASAEGKRCRGIWYLDGKFVSASELTLKQECSAEFRHSFTYTPSLPASAKLTFVLRYGDETGFEQERSAGKNIKLENYSEDYYRQKEIDRVLALVTTGYKGNYTLQWALDHDYAGGDKVIWVNAKGYESKTDYLIWVSIAYQRANVLMGSKGSWKLVKTFLVGTGAKGTDTPLGTWRIIAKLARGWTNDVYTVKPVVNFINASYGFHSRIYYPGTTKIQDKRIGFPCSHGCIRMYTEDIAWIYDTIPIGTTVVIY